MGSGVTALVLAGGQGLRMGGCDKGLQRHEGQSLVAHAIGRLRAQTWPPEAIWINANRHLEAYQALGLPLVSDRLPDFAGPLAGFQVGMASARTPWLLTVPCDSPHFPHDLLERLWQAVQASGADLAFASAPDESGQMRPQPVFCLMRCSLHASLSAFLDQGGRKIGQWLREPAHVMVPFDRPGDAQAFRNFNTLDDLIP